ncbi:hypothetical protein [Haloferax volcanii]|uniref:Uncharacterized protein n=3 Tax=Haloferax volcanii TaxID=2246 RepID=A0A384LI66_HALVD|nr:hypothetical protein [Haloferax volcanii]ADE03818.1 uncharacterized protein HVO_0193 [Haloferax volcanii DS2]ELY23884.1 hypothetical protein C498_19214 [Haloferax volcanii DS2]MBS8118637.1 hypothetical protein [Haloferax volcanii]MBS8123651.1 hypothetical protein [Haloferax volcanii]MBS8127520.1 hypothetical protein [Haloferax volcanii]
MPSDSLSPEERQQYDLVYHATKNAIWDVLGTAVYVLFLVFGGFLVLFVFVLPALSALSQTGGTPVVLGVGAVGLILFVAIGYRIVRLLQ